MEGTRLSSGGALGSRIAMGHAGGQAVSLFIRGFIRKVQVGRVLAADREQGAYWITITMSLANPEWTDLFAEYSTVGVRNCFMEGLRAQSMCG